SELIPDRDGRPEAKGPSPLDTPEGRQWLLELADQLKKTPGEDRRVRLVRRLNRALVKRRARSTP
ncbi:MAG TPA: hypothetical protein VFT74_19290, partial [Isosphaeraceae bacterium]|nr:hypothetical protein [Isosphaeraceae bacterium]